MQSDKTLSHRIAQADLAKAELTGAFMQSVTRARELLEAEFRLHTDHAGDVRHTLNPPLEVEEALDPTLDSALWIAPVRRR